MVKRTLYIFAIFSLLACSLTDIIHLPVKGDAQVEEQAVYAVILHDLTGAGKVVLSAQTSIGMGDDFSEQTISYINKEIGGVLTQELIDSFRARNDQSYPLPEDMNIGIEYVLITEAERQEIFNAEQDGWEVFYSRYPDSPGITTLSKVGFNAKFTQALVYIGNQSHWLAGAGFYILLKKVDGEWQVDKQVMAWIS